MLQSGAPLQVEGAAPVRIPIRLGVVGCPLHFQIVSQKTAQKPILRWVRFSGGSDSQVGPTLRWVRFSGGSDSQVGPIFRWV